MSERSTRTVVADMVRYYPDEWSTSIHDDGFKVFERGCGFEDGFTTDAEIEFDEYYTTFVAPEGAKLEVTLSFFEQEYVVDGEVVEEYEEDHTVESIEVVET